MTSVDSSRARSVPTVTPRPAVLTIGKFDGVHIGHQALARRACSLADALAVESAALVLHPHPATVLAGLDFPVLSTPDERAVALHALGVGHVETVNFDRALAETEPRHFIQMITGRFELRSIVVGPDFRFGRDRAGDIDLLETIGREFGFSVEIVEPIELDGEKVSSGRIRAAIIDGDVRSATRWLGRPPRLKGRVIHGAQRGREIGFPTANLELSANYVIPADGVYAVMCSWSDGSEADAAARSAMAAANIGIRPTFDAGARSIEAFLINFSGDLYGAEMTLHFVEFLRPELRFDDVESLIEAMHTDVQRARELLESKGSIGPQGLVTADA